MTETSKITTAAMVLAYRRELIGGGISESVADQMAAAAAHALLADGEPLIVSRELVNQ